MGQQQFKQFKRMQTHMSFSQFSVLNKQIQMVQLAQNRLTSANVLLTQIQLNFLLTNMEAECGVNPNSEDLGK